MSIAAAVKSREPGIETALEFGFDTSDFSVAALGVDLKNSTCLAADGLARLSDLHGDISDPDIYGVVSTSLQGVEAVDAVACDLHPDLHATRLATALAERLGAALIPVQHHYAHIAAVMAEHGLDEAVGLALDGFGYGADGTAWGGECLHVDGSGFKRLSHLTTVPLPGGDAASREPWRMAVAWLDDAELCERLFPDRPVRAVHRLCSSLNTPRSSSAGRLFDAAAAIIFGKEVQTFEGEAAMLLERAAGRAGEAAPLASDMTVMIRQIAESMLSGGDKPSLALGFHHALADCFASMALRAAGEKGVSDVVLAGGCFANRLLRERVVSRLEASELKVFMGERIPSGDGAVALGQAWVAVQSLNRKRR